MIINQFPFVYGGNNNGRTYKSNALHGRTARSASRRNRGERRGIAPLAHTATVELSPEWSQPDEVIDYTFKITNEADSDPIQQVWIYKNPLYEDFVCDPITGWNLNYHNVYQPGTNQIVTDACQWVAQAGLTDGFDDDTSKDFTFTAKTPAGAGDVCELKWYVQTVDTYPGEIGGDANMNHGFTSIDVTPPVITTELFGTNVTHNGDLYVHPSDSYVEITANDVADVDCQSGIDYCDWTLYRNGEVEDSGTEYGSGEPSITWNVYFDRDSDHELVVDCWDVAGNQADQVTEEYIVDGTAPVTSWSHDGPLYQGTYQSGTLRDAWYANGGTTFTLSAEDNKFDASGVTTQYRLHYFDDPADYHECFDHENALNPLGNGHVAGPYDGDWIEYEGETIGGFNESCNVIEFKSYDKLQNHENVQYLRFFVDKTPPELTKTVEDAIPHLCDLDREDVVDTWTGADFSVGNKDDFDLTMTRTFTCEGVTIDVELGLDKTEDDVTASGIQVVLTNGAEPIGLVGINDAEFGGVPYIKEWDNGWGDAEALPPGVTVTGVAGGTDFSISVDLAVLNAILGDTSTLGWAVNAEADWKDTAGSSQKHFPADWTRWTANGAYHETLNFFGTTDTVVTLVCEDVGPHPSGGEVVHWALHRTEDGETWEQVDGGVTRNQDTVTFDQTSLHRLSAWCIDAVDKMSEQDVEYFKIDDEAPVLTKTLVGPHDGPDCPAGTDQVPDNGDMEAECYLKMGETEVHLSVEDFMEGDAAVHYSGGAYCTYTIKYDGVYEHYDGGYFDEDNPAVIVFEYDSEHILSVTCKDLLGNTMSDVERFLVDGTPPVTDKDYGQPMVFDGTYRWITSSTPITLEADDEKIGVAYINYSVEWVSDDVCEAYPDVVGPVADVSGGTFEFKSTNEENIGTNRPHVVMLDANSTHVVLEVNYGGPLMSCFEVRPDGDTSLSSGSNPWYDIPDYYNTAPHFTCLTGPDSAILEVEADGYVEVRVSVGAESDWYFDWVRFDVAPEWTMVEGESVEFTIDETSCHVIRYFAVDKFGHEEEMQQQFVMVDNQAPNGTKIVGEPKIVVEDEICIVDDAPGSGAGFDGQTGESSYGSPYIVCRADTETAWVSANSGGQYDALNICNSLGYTYLADWGGTCGTVCGYCGSGGLEHYDGTGYTNENFLSTTVTWLCSNTAPVASGSVEVDEALAGTADGITPDAIASLEASPEYNGENGNGGSTEPGSVCFDYYTYVTQDTPITLSCEDVMPHPVGGEVIGFKVYNDGEDITESYCNLGREECDGDFCEKVVEFPGFGMEYDGEYCLVTGMMLREAELLAKGFAGVSYEFDFNEDSEHVLKWYCEDALGNRKDMADQFYYVETVPPVTELEITGPQYTADGVTWTDTETRYELDAYDPEPHPSGVNRTYYAWALVDDAYCWGEATMEDVGTCLLVDTAHEYSAETPYDEDLEVEVLYGTDGMVTFTATTPITFVDGSQDNVAFTFDANNDGEANFQMSYHADQGSHYDGDYWGYREVVGGSWTSWMVLPTWVSVSESGMDTFSVTFDLDHLGGCGADYRFGVAGWGVSTQITPGQNVPFSFPETFSWGPNWVESDDYHAESAPVDFAVYEGEFDIPEESCHAIAFYSVDNLGNTENVSTEYVFVDKTPPIIEKSYEGPFHVVSDRYSDEYGYGFTMSKYIHPDNTLIHLWAEDAWPHPSGLAKAEYRITQVADEYCVQGEYWEWDNGVGPREYVEPEPVNVECDAEGEGDWTEFDGYVNVTVGQESCHVIEVRAWDNVEKYSEHTQCVFVDGTPPETNKLVGKPSSNMAKLDIELGEAYFGPESGFEHAPFLNETFCAKDPMNCLEVTLHTPIQLRCEDPEPHPSGIAGVYFMVHRNGDSMTEDYCGDGVVNDDGYCYVEGGHEGFFQFSNLSWHRLEYYCVDNVGNVGESDVEYFKVDGVAFNLTINKKWNLVSTPVFLREDALDAIFAEHGDKIVSVWAYDPYDGWLVYSPNAPSTLDTMEPGSGYWILATEDFELVVGGSLLRPGPQPLPGKLIKGGWNLIGYLPGRDGALVAGSDPVLSYSGPAGAGKEVHCALESIATDYLQVISSSLWTYWEPDSSAPWHPLDQWTDRMDPGAGYWYYYQTQLEDAMYVPPSNICSDIVS